MGFDSAKTQNLREIIATKGDRFDTWNDPAFCKLVDAKIGIEISDKLLVLAQAMGEIGPRMHTAVDKLIVSNEKLSESNSNYSRSICILTLVLVFVGALPYLENLIDLLLKLIFKV
ncbi:MAG: hypothetical protein ABIC68_05975 [Candidatus Omnitrophota bacterium]